ncbi:MAG: M48 family metalloprotease [Candidatus Doudnabacteria bacterium]
MKTIALLFSLFLTIVFGFLILSNFTSISFNYQDLLLYIVVALIIYLIVRAVGGSLDKKFNNSVQNFLDGKKKELFDDKGLLRTFGLLLITLLPFLFYLLVLALFAAIDFALYGLMLISNLERVPIGILIGLAVVAIGTGIAILIGFYYLFFPPKRKTSGITIIENEQKELWNLTKEIAKEIKAKPIDKIIITPDPGIGVYLQGNLFSTIFGGGERVLEIGLSSLYDLTVDEFRAILAHEYGHFSNRDTSWSSYTYLMGNSLINTLHSMPGPSQDEKEKGGLVRFMMMLNPAYWLLLLYVKLYFKITNGFSRIREVMADIMAMQMYGGKAFGNGLLKIAMNDTIFSEIIQSKYVPGLLKEEKTISNFSKFMEVVFKSLNKKDIEEFQNNILSRSQIHNVYDSHPALKIRIDYSKKFEDNPGKDQRPVGDLFDNWGEINEKAAELYNLRLLYYIQAIAKANEANQQSQ